MMKKEPSLTAKIRSIMDQIKKQAAKEEKRLNKMPSVTLHPDQKLRGKDKD